MGLEYLSQSESSRNENKNYKETQTKCISIIDKPKWCNDCWYMWASDICENGVRQFYCWHPTMLKKYLHTEEEDKLKVKPFEKDCGKLCPLIRTDLTEEEIRKRLSNDYQPKKEGKTEYKQVNLWGVETI